MRKISILYLIPALLMLVTPLQTAADDFLRGDVDLDGKVSITDVTTLINYLLNNEWPEDEPQPETVTYVLNGIEINMVRVEGGTFTMGASGADTEASSNEFPAHVVTLSTYYICTTEVTQQLWRAVMGSNPSTYTGDLLCPVEKVSWTSCQNFVNKLNEMTGQNFRLPTEAEWEFAARGGNLSKGYKYPGSNDVDEVAWYKDNSDNTTHPVASKKPNELGLYDMSGNVYEWCQDYYGSYNDTQAVDPTGPATGAYRVQRNSGIKSSSIGCRVSHRGSNVPEHWTSTSNGGSVGLRLAM